MRLVRTQARLTINQLKDVEKIILEAVRTNDFRYLNFYVSSKLKMSNESKELLRELSAYEAEFTTKRIKKYYPYKDTGVVKIEGDAEDFLISTTLNKPSATIEDVYNAFALSATNVYTQVLEEDDVEEAVQQKTAGLLSVQAMALAGLAVLGTANMTRNEVASQLNMQVDWVLDLELNNCPDCEDYADNSPYDPDEVDGLIPLHANCGCTLVPIE